MINIEEKQVPHQYRNKYLRRNAGSSASVLTTASNYVPGGDGASIEIIGLDSAVPASDTNVMSSFRSLVEFISKTTDSDITAVHDFIRGLKVDGNMISRLLLQDTDAEEMTDTDVMSALRVLAEIRAGNEGLKEKFLSKISPDETRHLLKLLGGIEVENGIISDSIEASETVSGKNILAAEAVAGVNVTATNTVSGNTITATGVVSGHSIAAKETVSGKNATISQKATTLNLLVQALADMYDLSVSHVATMFRTVIKDYVSSELYTPGLSGSGMKLYKSLSGDWNLELDNVTVRKAMTIFELIISKIRAVNGGLVVSPANGRVKSVATTTDSYVLGIEGDMMFVADDLVRCQVFNANQLKYYWVRVSRVDGTAIHVLKSEFSAGVVPGEGDDLVLFGNKTNPARQGVLYLTASEDGKPRFSVLDGVNSTDLTDKTKVILGCLDGITDTDFSADFQPSGYGLYSANVFLKGIFVLRNGKTFEDELSGQITAVQTAFEIREGVISTKVTEATTAATNAKKSETNASISATTAGQKATAAAGSATAAQQAANSAGAVLEEVTVKESSITQTAGQIATKVTEVEKKVTEATAAATAASTSATNAKKSADSAATKLTTITEKESSINQTAGQISTKVTEVTKKATEAATSASNAASSAGTAGTKATAAANSATAAAGSATNAKSAADTAAAKLTTITEKESSINQTAGQISTKVTEVTKKATEAASSASTATAKATAAANSATAAAGSASTASTKASAAANSAELALAMSKGKMLYRDPTFKTGNNYCSVYNNSGNGTVTVTRVTGISGNPNGSGYCLKVNTTGAASPGFGGFYFGTQTKANQVLISRVIANIPAGRSIVFATNATGNGSATKWLTPTAGTGKWEEYACKVACGTSGTFSSTYFFYITGGSTPTASAPLTWYVSYATVFDVTDAEIDYLADAAAKYTTKTEHSSSITQLSNSIELKVAKTDFNALGSRVSSAETTIRQHTDQIALKAAKTDVTALGTRVTAAEAKITPDAIKLTVKSQTDTIAANAAKRTEVWVDATALDATKYYPVTINLSTYTPMYTITAERTLSTSYGKPSWSTHTNGFSVVCRWTTNACGWGTNAVQRTILEYTYSFTNVIPLGSIGQLTNSSNEYVYVRGGSKYRIIVEGATGVGITLRTAAYTVNSQTVNILTAVTAPAVDLLQRPTTDAIKASLTIDTGGITLLGKKISLAGMVTFSALDAGAQSTINGKATPAQIATAKTEAINAAASDATTKANNAKTSAVSTAASDATTKANNAKTAAINTAASDATTKANNAKTAAISAAASDATTKANNALTNSRNDVAVKMGYSSYTDMVNKAAANQTIINGGYIRTSLIKVDELITSNLLATKIAATAITTGKLTVTTGAKIGGWSVSGNSLVTKSESDAKIIVEPNSARYLKINDSQASLMEIRADGINGINMLTKDITGKCLNISAFLGAVAIYSQGCHVFCQRSGDTWDAPGALWAGRISGEGRVENSWGNGCYVYSAQRLSTGRFRVNHNIGHTGYFVQITCTPYTSGANHYGFGVIEAKTAQYFEYECVGHNGVVGNVATEVCIIGRNKY